MTAATTVTKGDLSVAGNQPAAWAYRGRWNPQRNYGYFTLGRVMYRCSLADGDERCETWHVAKVVERPGEPDDLAAPFTVCLPTPGSGFAASCDCPAWTYSKTTPRDCKHRRALASLLESLEVHDVNDDEVDRLEREEAIMAELNGADPFA